MGRCGEGRNGARGLLLSVALSENNVAGAPPAASPPASPQREAAAGAARVVMACTSPIFTSANNVCVMNAVLSLCMRYANREITYCSKQLTTIIVL